MTTREISNSDDVIDSRDVLARIEDLVTQREDWVEERGETDKARADYLKEFSDDEAELAALLKLQEQAEGYCDDWKYGAALIRDSYFTDYAREMVSDIGDLPKEIPSYIEIDWEATARNIQQDYTSVEFDSVTYWVR